MIKVHTLAGLPRSGSTLLLNVLAQHPDVSVTGTSALSQAVEAVATVLSGSPEVQSDLVNVPGSPERYAGALRALIEAWHSDAETPVVINKGRGWAAHRLLLDSVMPDSVLIVTVRDPRDVFASVERQHRETGMFNSPFGGTIYEMADTMLAPQGIIGGPLKWCEDLIRRNHKSVEFVRYETFVRDPLTVLAKLETRLGLAQESEKKGKKPFAWDTDNVVNVSTDLDELYLGKFPHEGSGPIKSNGSSWTDTLAEDLANLIAGVAPLYMQTFAYPTT